MDKLDVIRAVALAGGCAESAVSVGEFGRLRSGGRSIWVRCPAMAARSLFSKGYLVIDWFSATVEFLKIPRIQCYKCWNFGHVRETCKSVEDRSGLCFGCGLSGHNIKECTNIPRCVLCYANRLDSAHRMGSVRCKSVNTPKLSRSVVEKNL